ncbi:MAG: hypothetical protein QW231_05800 [Candidatus Bathyarchaeia archaeon]
MQFMNANVFVHAILKPKKLNEETGRVKDAQASITMQKQGLVKSVPLTNT